MRDRATDSTCCQASEDKASSRDKPRARNRRRVKDSVKAEPKASDSLKAMALRLKASVRVEAVKPRN